VDIGCGMAAVCTSLTAEQIDEPSLRRVYDQIGRDVPVGRAQHRDERAQVDAARPFEPKLAELTERHPQLLKASGVSPNGSTRWAPWAGATTSSRCLAPDRRAQGNPLPPRRTAEVGRDGGG
jgi:hypothetical protein